MVAFRAIAWLGVLVFVVDVEDSATFGLALRQGVEQNYDG